MAEKAKGVWIRGSGSVEVEGGESGNLAPRFRCGSAGALALSGITTFLQVEPSG